MGGYHQDSRIALPMTIMSTDGVEDVYIILLSLVPSNVHVSSRYLCRPGGVQGYRDVAVDLTGCGGISCTSNGTRIPSSMDTMVWTCRPHGRPGIQG